MGPSGCGKSTLAKALARRLAWTFVEGDELHPQANIDKMRAGLALDDADREPFLRAVGAALAEGRATGVVVSCSALKRRYRDLLRELAGADLLFVLPRVSRSVLARRLAGRRNRFMPTTLLASQLAALEPLQDDERGITLPRGLFATDAVAHLLATVNLLPPDELS
jgi:carbohydrate kinase (thermoresistant glucokinase family)